MQVHGYVDVNTGEIRNFSVQSLAADPSGAGLYEGRLWVNSTTDLLKTYLNGTIVTVAPGGATYTDEQARNAVAAMFAAGTHTGATVTNDDPGDNLDIAVTDSPLLEGSDKAYYRSTDNHLDGSTNHVFTAADDTKLTGVATGATANDTDANLRARASHTGTQAASTVSDFDTQVRTSRLDQMAAPTANVSAGANKIVNLTDGTAATDAATYGQILLAQNGLDVKTSVRAASTANVAIATALENGDAFGGVTLATGDRVLLKDQTAGAENGIYVVPASGAAARSTDADASAEVTSGFATWVEEGTNANSRWVLTTANPITLNTTALVFAKDFQAADIIAGAGITKTGATLDVVAADATVVVAADSVRVGNALSSLFGDTAAVSFTIAHGRASKNRVVSVYLESSGEQVYPIVVVDATNIVISGFAAAPATDAYRVNWF